MSKTMQINKATGAEQTSQPPAVINSGLIEYAEVIDTILNESHKSYTGFHDIGKIFVRRAKRDYGKHSNAAIVAYPFFPNQRYHPLRFEIVMLVKGPTMYAGETNSECYYYFSSYNIWGLANHNALPYIAGLQVSESELNRGGKFGDLNEKATPDSLEFGDTFLEKAGVPILQPYEGDYIIGGRWGNNIRFGSTVTSGKPKNNWSKSGTDGDPIIIISNSKPKSDKMGQILVEDINIDDSSIYLCTNQKIELEPSSDNYKAYKSLPDKPNVFQGNQVLINSDRLIFNAKKSDILFFAKKSIGLSAAGTINISADGEFYVDAKKHYIGAKAEEPIMFGKKTKSWLKELLTAIKAITVPTGTGPSGTPVNMAQFDTLAQKLDQLLSQKAFVE